MNRKEDSNREIAGRLVGVCVQHNAKTIYKLNAGDCYLAQCFVPVSRAVSLCYSLIWKLSLACTRLVKYSV